MGSNYKIKISWVCYVVALFLYANDFNANNSANDNDKSAQQTTKQQEEYYKKLIVDFFTSINCARLEFSQFKENKKIGYGSINFDRREKSHKFIKIDSHIGKRQFIINGESLDKLEFEDVYLEEKKTIKSPEIVRLLFGNKKDVFSIIKDSQITVKDLSKVICIINYDDFTGDHKILLCFKLKPFTLTFWRVINRGKTTSYIKVDSLHYNYL